MVSSEKRFFRNLAPLTILQFSNYLLPIITVPFLVRVLGPSNFGILAFASSLITLLNVFVDYGFNISATREASINRNNEEKLAEIFSAVLFIKFSLMMSILFFLCIAIFNIDFLYEERITYLMTFLMIIGNTLTPMWLFHGLEQMKAFSLISFIPKLIATALIFVVIRNQSDYILVPIINGLAAIFAGIFSLFFVKNFLNLSFVIIPYKKIKHHFIKAKEVFFSNVSLNVLDVTPILILGAFWSTTIVGYYAAAQRIVIILKGIYYPVFQALFPLIQERISSDKISGIRLVKTWLSRIFVLMLILSSAVFAFAEPITIIFLGSDYIESINILRVLAFVPLFYALNHFVGITLMVSLGFQKQFALILLFALIFFGCISLLLVQSFSSIGVAFASLLSEIAILTSLLIFLISTMYIQKL